MAGKKNLTEREKYLRDKKRYRFSVVLTQLGILIAIILSWELLAQLGIIDSFITSSPSRMFETFKRMLSQDLLTHIGVTCFETLVGFLLGSLAGTFIASMLWWSPFLSEVSSP